MFNLKDNHKKLIGILFLFFSLFIIFFKFNRAVKAQWQVWGGPVSTNELSSVPTEKETTVIQKNKMVDEQKKKLAEARKKSFYAIINNALMTFTQQMAYKTAVNIAQGGPGGEPLNFSIPWKDYLEDASGAALGDFLGSMSKTWEVDLCDPGMGPKKDLILGLITEKISPLKPQCDWKDVQKNWNKLSEASFSKNLSISFEPKTSYLGSALSVKEKMEQAMTEAEKEAERERGIPQETGFKPVTEAISEYIKTPGPMIGKLAWDPKEEDRAMRAAQLSGSIAMGDILASAGTMFVNTLAAKLMEKWLKKGMFTLHDIIHKNPSDLLQQIVNMPDSSGTNVSSKESISNYYKDVIEPSFETKGSYSVLSDFSCPFPDSPGPNNCIIDDDFRIAIESKMTVGEALKQGNLKSNWKFGFISKDIEPSYNEGYPYRSMIVLRKYRIIPVGWEIAAQYINRGWGKNQTYTLGEMVKCYDPYDNWGSKSEGEDWCRGLVDPNWLLKALANDCEKQGYGREIINEMTINGIDADKDGKYYNANPSAIDDNDKAPERLISRNKFCAADKTCVQELPQGGCLKWGYCAEEKRIWKFKGAACDENYNTCQSFTSSTGQKISYLKNTLDYGICNAGNAGCQWYCNEASYDNIAKKVNWMCKADSSNPSGIVLPEANTALYLTSSTEKCAAQDEGCHKYIRFQAGNNLVYDGDLERGNEEIYLSGDDFSGISAEDEKKGKDASADSKINDWPIEKNGAAYIKVTRAIEGGNGNYYKVETNGVGNGLYSYDASDAANKEFSLLPENYHLDIGKNYALTAYIKVEKGAVEMGLGNSNGGLWKATSSSPALLNQWERLVIYLPSGEIGANKIYIHSSKLSDDADKLAVFYVDNVQLEEVEVNAQGILKASGYKNYENSGNVLFSKKAPSYLKCNENNPPLECSKYALECNESEAGCNKYTPTNGEPWIPAIIQPQDRCDKECVNYKSYKQSATNFSKERMNINFIADNPYVNNLGGAVCSAEAAGCEEFTNLDKLERGGEAREYYTYLKHCIKPDNRCGNFYAWIGNDATGYQLKAYYLEKDGDKPKELENPQDLGSCSSHNDAISNSENCKEFYDEAGKVSYVKYRNTVTCSDDCHPYRRTSEKLNQSACGIYGSKFVDNQDVQDTASIPNSCAGNDCVCRLELENCLYSGGKWTNKECIYYAVPNEGLACQASEAGCYEYKGTRSSNIKVILKEDFEKEDIGWTNGVRSNRSVYLNGHSLSLSVGAAAGSSVEENISGKLDKNKIYSISFLANSKVEDKTLKVRLKSKDFLAVRDIKIKNSNIDDWNVYTVGPIYLAGDLNENGNGDGKIDNSDLSIMTNAVANEMSILSNQREKADINGDGKITAADSNLLESFIILPSATINGQFIEIGGIEKDNIFIDNLIIKEIRENIYLIKDSWTMPEKCDTPAVGTQLGCAEYNDMSGQLWQLKSFSNLCPSRAAGCERMIDTQNSESVFSQSFNMNDTSRITILRDKIIYVVNNPSTYCSNQKFKGCQRLGVPQLSQSKAELKGYLSDAYLINDPDRYNNILCSSPALDCLSYTGGDGNGSGTYYFKDPKDKICEFVDGRWVKKNLTANAQGTREVCPITYNPDLTLGSAPGLKISVPSNGWVGLCPADQSGCTEYIDPLNNNSSSRVFNGNFEQDAEAAAGGMANGPDGWQNAIGCGIGGCVNCCNRGYGQSKAIKQANQTIHLEDKGLYTLSARVVGNGKIAIGGCDLYSLDGTMTSGNNELFIEFKDIKNNEGAQEAKKMKSGRFYVRDAGSGCSLIITTSDNAENDSFLDEINVQTSGIYYYIGNSIDKGECAGNINPDNGCVLINERQFLRRDENSKPIYKTLVYDADEAYIGGLNSSCNETNRDVCKPSANEIIKVEPDRVCGKWLYNITSEDKKDSKGMAVREFGECAMANKEGDCVLPVYSEKKNANFQSGNISLMKDISGLSKVGFDWNNIDDQGIRKKIEGYLPISNMKQIGQTIKNFNGSFEDIGKISEFSKPAKWEYPGKGWISEYFGVISHPGAAQKKGLPISAPDGKNFLELNKNYTAVSEKLPVYENTEYVISAFMNAADNPRCGIYIDFYDSKDGKIGSSVSLELTTKGKVWQFISKRFKTAAGTKSIKIRLFNADNAASSSYFDDIVIMPALEIREPRNDYEEGTAKEATSICKVYPEEDALACEYKNNNGLTYQGERGYCLEYDRAPGNPNNCVSWFPVDIVRGGEGKTVTSILNEGPLYYCLEAQFLESNQVTFIQEDGCGDPAFDMSCADYIHIQKTRDCEVGITGKKGSRDRHWCYPQISNVVLSPSGVNFFPIPSWSYDGPANKELVGAEALFYYNGSLVKLTAKEGVQKYQEEFKARCTKIAQVADLSGENKMWVDRLRTNNNYIVPNLKFNGGNYKYANITAPYGAIGLDKLEAFSSPDSWDGEPEKAGKQALALMQTKHNETGDLILNQIIPALPYSCANINYPDVGCATNFSTNATLGEDSVKEWKDEVGNENRNNIIRAQESIKRLFAKGYSGWQWNDAEGKYEKVDKFTSVIDKTGTIQETPAVWGPPTAKCQNNTRPQCANKEDFCAAEYCGVRPRIEKIKVGGKTQGDINLGISNSILFQFNSIIDINQGPITAYYIEWGDRVDSGEKLRISPQPNENDPHTFSHSYSYYDLLSIAENKGVRDNADCISNGSPLCCFSANFVDMGNMCQSHGVKSGSGCCLVKPRVRIKDNWDWCNNIDNMDNTICADNVSKWSKFNGWIVLSEH